jgi:predicted phage terminase large subunit-like protein
MPIIYIYGRDCYVADCICDNGDPGIVEERLARKLVEHKVQMAQFESNSAGWHIAQHVQKRVDNLGGITKITTKTTTSNKETKIVVNAPAVKERFLFLDSSKYKARSDYGKAMAFLTGYTLVGKNKHDDVPDGMAMAALYIESFNASKVEILRRPF